MEMAACVGTPNSSTEPTAAASASTIETLLCDHCRCPIASVWDVLPAEENASAWRDHVYSYELDLFNNGAPPIQAYSATNPSKRRFDLLRLAPHVTVPHIPDKPVKSGDDRQPLVQLPGTQTSSTDEGAAQRAPPFVECDTTDYSSEHSFFVGYAWCFCHCSNCGAFLGWGFASEARLRAAARTRARDEQHNVTRQSRNDDGADAELHNSPSRRRLDNAESTGQQADAADLTFSANTASNTQADETAGRSREENVLAAPDHVNGSDSSEPHSSGANSTTSCTSGATGSDGDANAVSRIPPDFIGIIITHCTGEPNYPVASLLQETVWRPWRLRRRRRVERVIRQLRGLLLEMEDGYRAHQLYYVCESIVAQAYQTAPPRRIHTSRENCLHDNSDHAEEIEEDTDADDGVPQHLLNILQLARVALEQQRDDRVREESSDRHEDHDDGEQEEDTADDESGDAEEVRSRNSGEES